jgi:hypothetical protein
MTVYLIYLSVSLSIYGSTALLLYLGRTFRFLIIYAVGRTPWTGDEPLARPLPTHGTTQTQNKRTQTSTFWVGFESTIPTFEQAKTVSARPPWSSPWKLIIVKVAKSTRTDENLAVVVASRWAKRYTVVNSKTGFCFSQGTIIVTWFGLYVWTTVVWTVLFFFALECV